MKLDYRPIGETVADTLTKNRANAIKLDKQLRRVTGTSTPGSYCVGALLGWMCEALALGCAPYGSGVLRQYDDIHLQRVYEHILAALMPVCVGPQCPLQTLLMKRRRWLLCRSHASTCLVA